MTPTIQDIDTALAGLEITKQQLLTMKAKLLKAGKKKKKTDHVAVVAKSRAARGVPVE